MPIRVLIVDDSALVCRILTTTLSRFADIEVVASAPDPFEARRLIVELKPDVVTLDVELPRMDGITFLRKVMQHHPLPVVVVSSFTQAGSTRAVEALEAGALQVVAKPSRDFALEAMAEQLAQAIRQAAAADMEGFQRARRSGLRALAAHHAAPPCRVVLIGGSLGGPGALSTILTSLPADGPAIVAALHMPGQYTATFARRLDDTSRMQVAEATQGAVIAPGTCLLAPGDVHTLITNKGERPRVILRHGPPVRSHRPSIDALFNSAAKALQASAVGIILTGMGADGADGLGQMRAAGALTVAQDEATSVVWGMPGEAVKRDAADYVVPLADIASLLIRLAGVRPGGRPPAR